MRHILLGVLASLVVVNPIYAQQRSTPAEAEAMVKKAVAYFKQYGKEKAFAEINNPKGLFVDRDLYVSVSDLNGLMLAHGGNAKMVGKSFLEFKDVDGKFIMKERIQVLKKANYAWQEYKFVNPVTKQIEPKTAYFEKVGDLIFGCGAYKK